MIDRPDARGRTLAEGAHAESARAQSEEFVYFAKEDTEQSIPERFEEQARKFPERIALRVAGREFTYDALNRTANRIARAILAIEAEGEQRVAMMLEQDDPLLAAAILGILKAGKVYVPIDPSYPPARTNYVLEDSQAALIVAGSSSLSLARELAGNNERRRVLNIDEIVDEIGAGPSDEDPSLPIGPDAVAYIIYTSGSTGEPKGVIQTHRNLLGFVRNYTNSWRIRSGDRMTLFYSPSFSQSLMDIFGALLKGAALHPYDVKKEGLANLATWLIKEGITVFDSVPSLYRNFVDALSGDEEFPELRLIRLGGEPLSRELVTRSRKHFPGCVLVNQLAATETSMIAQYFIDGETKITGSTVVPAGYAVDGVEVSLIDEATGAEVGFEQVGEIAIKSRYLSPGYWRRPDLSQAAFRLDPRGERLYRTGDLGRMRPDGCLEYLGRKDLRVKIRGHSVEVAEIEAALLELAEVKEAAVRALELAQDDARLVAYIVPRDESFPSVSRLRAALAEALPDHMIPSAFVRLGALPLTPSGKVDRRALPEPDEERPDLEGAYEAPRTPVEEALARVWEEMLGLERVGVHDDFFELGGHSLLATQVISRLRDAFGVELSLPGFFEGPTVAGLAEKIEEARQAGQSPPAPPLVPAPRDSQSLPLSFAQQRLWLVDRLEPGTSTYNISNAMRLTGRLDATALERSLEETVRRHEVLRTRFEMVDGEPVQVIAPSQEALEVPITDLSELPQAEREAEALRLAREEAQRPFDLERGPLFRARLLRLGEEEHILLLTKHHIVSDAWSNGLISRELSAVYEAFSEGKPSPLEELPIQYADYALWQREWLTGEVLDRQLGYWKQQLADLPTLELPTDRPRPAVQTHRGAHQDLELPESLTQALKDLSRREGATLFMVLLAAFQVLLARYADQEDVAVGTPIAGRNRAETEGLIGFFVNTLVMCTDLSGDPTFKELLSRVREVALGAYDHQDVPFERLVEELNPERDLSRSPLFQVMFGLQNAPRQDPELAGLTLSQLEIGSETAQFDLTLDMFEETDGLLKGELEYSTDLFDEATIERMVGHFRTLLEGVVADPEARLSELELLTEAQRRQILLEWNETHTEYPRDACIHELFEEQAKRTPDAVAVVFEEQQLSYRELNHRANQLAHYLRSLEVGPEVLVGVFMERSLEMVVGLLGVLKAGGAYVPLDPAYPRERLAFMLEDTQASVLLTQEGTQQKLPEHRATVLILDSAWEVIAQESTENPISGATAEHPAYVIYTSGSTGTPKGVLGLHRASVNRFAWMWRSYPFAAEEVCCQKTSLSFVDSVWEIFGPLLRGIQIVLIPEATVKDAHRLVEVLAAHRVTRIVVVPSLLGTLLSTCPDLGSRLPQLRHWVTSGEALPVELCTSFAQKMPQSTLINLYGSSEVSADATCYDTRQQQSASTTRVPIGRPIANTQIYLLNSHLEPVPIGVVGELHVGGEGLARGYLKRPELTAEKFIPDPFSDEPGARLYKTGDLARYLADGNIEFLGRVDHQVKIRGYRIELGEIETTLDQHPAVRGAVVSAKEGALGDKQLVAYVVPGSQPQGLLPELRGYLKQKLPAYMVPSTFTLLDEVPLTPNGKVNRKALPTPEADRSALEEAFVAPRTPVEEQLVGIWEEVLGLERIGVHDDFFELGGHSLLAVQVLTRLNRHFGVELPLRTLFEEPTISGLALAVTQRRAEAEIDIEQMLAQVEQMQGRSVPQEFSEER